LNALLNDLEEPSFLLNCVLAMAAKFSDHENLSHALPRDRGRYWHAKAREEIGDVMNLPTRETIMGFVLLACLASVEGLSMAVRELTVRKSR
jgi:hypothetical protein